jgi:hypothetical protein
MFLPGTASGNDSSISTSQVTGITGTHYHAWPPYLLNVDIPQHSFFSLLFLSLFIPLDYLYTSIAQVTIDDTQISISNSSFSLDTNP